MVIGAVWVFAATATAILPMHKQYAPGLTLLLLAPGIIAWLAVDHGWWIGALGLAAFVSMFRNPLRYIWARLRGQIPHLLSEADN